LDAAFHQRIKTGAGTGLVAAFTLKGSDDEMHPRHALVEIQEGVVKCTTSGRTERVRLSRLEPHRWRLARHAVVVIAEAAHMPVVRRRGQTTWR
jgi:hypothetical protein